MRTWKILDATATSLPSTLRILPAYRRNSVKNDKRPLERNRLENLCGLAPTSFSMQSPEFSPEDLKKKLCHHQRGKRNPSQDQVSGQPSASQLCSDTRRRVHELSPDAFMLGSPVDDNRSCSGQAAQKQQVKLHCTEGPSVQLKLKQPQNCQTEIISLPAMSQSENASNRTKPRINSLTTESQ